MNYRIGVVGLGYVGLPLAIELSKKYEAIGFDVNTNLVEQLHDGIDINCEIEKSLIDKAKITFTSSLDDLKNCNIYIITVPTPIDAHNIPNLSPLRIASKMIGSILSHGDIVIYESTVFPGATEEICVPILESESGLRPKKDFKYGYSPERINPGDKVNTITKIKKLTSGCDDLALNTIDEIYKSIILAGTHRCDSIKIAEASKVMENTQRDVNIAFMNELNVLFDNLEIDISKVLEAAGTKWNFLNFQPGLVGGHCISVDPYYLTHKSDENGLYSEIISAARRINNNVPRFVVQKILKTAIRRGMHLSNSRILIAGVTFKEDCSDTRNSKVFDLVDELQLLGLTCDLYDPLCTSIPKDYAHLQTFSINKSNYDIIVVAVSHQEFISGQSELFFNILTKDGFIFDIKNCLKDSNAVVKL